MNRTGGLRVKLVALVLFLGMVSAAWGRIIFVDCDASGGGDGSSWAVALKYLQDGLAAASTGDEILVAEGVYKPDRSTGYPEGSRSRDATFQLKNGVVIKGGYAGFGEPEPDARDIGLYETILSGDLNGDDGPYFANNGENSYHVVTASGTDATAVLGGFTVTGGNADVSGHIDGGGLYSERGSATLVSCTFIGNSALCYGGGMFNYTFGRPTLINCAFIANSAEYGGGMESRFYGEVTLINCLFSGNTAEYGGGMGTSGSGAAVNNCVFSGNTAMQRGGGMYNRYDSTVSLSNSILWGNSAFEGEQITMWYFSTLFVSYCNLEGGEGAIYVEESSVDWGDGNIDLDPCFVQAGYWDVNAVWVEGDYRFLRVSPCIDAGDNSSVPADDYDLDGDGDTTEPIPWDLQGRPRFVDCPDVPDTGSGTPPIIDLGVHEFSNTAPIADAGPDRTAYAWIDGAAEANLDAGGSYDAEGDELTYQWSWTVDGNDFKANGVRPAIRLPVGEHTIELIVSDGTDRSEPDDVRITVLPAIQAPMKLTPQVLNPDSKGRWVKAHLVLSQEYCIEDVDVNCPATIEPFGIESQYIDAFVNEEALVEIKATFSRADFCGAMTGDRAIEAAVVGSLTSGQHFYGRDTIKLSNSALKHLAGLASYWLEAGCDEPDWCHGFDLNQDSVVNFEDFAWFEGCCIEIIGE